MTKMRLAKRVSNISLRSSRAEIIGLKFFAPFILLVIPFSFVTKWLREEFLPGQLLLVGPMTLAALFFLSIAVIEVRDGTFYYRRFLKWTPVDRDEILTSGMFWLTGYIRLKRYVFPWGRISFVLDENVNSSIFRRDSRILRHLKRISPE